ncbi:MAG TPA: glycosyltransferase [Gemmatimonadaceae bacterium]|nr:glycosyltransferase [Gemmatimonadaceae bacterium]
MRPNRLRVLHTLPSAAVSYGGPTYSAKAFADAGAAAGEDVTIAAPVFAHEGPLGLHERDDSFTLRLFPGQGRGAFVASRAMWMWLRREVRTFDVVHIHTLLNPVSAVTAWICRRAGVPYVVRPCGMLSRYSYEHRRRLLKRAYFTLVDRGVVTGAAAVQFTTDVEANEARERVALDPSRVVVVPPPYVPNALRLPRAPGTDAPVVFLARLNPVKGLETLLAAWREVVARRPAARLVIAGDGEAAYVESLRVLAEQLGIASRVEFAGFVSGARKAELLAGAALVVLPSKHENFGVAVLEAIGAGVPVIVSPEVQLSSFVRRHALGVVVEREPAKLAAAIVQVIGDDALQARCAVAGPAAVESSFSVDRIGRALEEMYLSFG